MAEYIKYQHIVRYDYEEVDGIDIGECFIFPKLDGTNSQVWIDNGIIKAGSRRRELNETSDNAGFYAWACQQSNIKNFLLENPDLRLFGEWLVPHSLTTYEDSAWRKFYIFDVCKIKDGMLKYLHYEKYKPLLDRYGLNYISPMKKIINGSDEDFRKCLEENTFLIKDGFGYGEGIVIKNYSFINKFGRTVWAKLVRNDFKDKHRQTMGASILTREPVEKQIANKYITKAFVEKEKSKIELENGGWSPRYIPKLLGRMYYELINEDIWDAVKLFKNPTIDFAKLYKFVAISAKSVTDDVF